MKNFYTIPTFLGLVLGSIIVDSARAQGNPAGCITNVDANRDYFPDKVSPRFSKLWSITYHNTYKIVKNLDDNTTYLLYQCGTEPPSNVPANLTLSIPLQNGIALSVTTHLPHFELLGLRDEIKAYLGDKKWISSPCMNERFETRETINIAHPSDEGAMDRLFSATNPEIVLFVNPGFKADVPNTVSATAWKERNNHGIGEWHKYFSVFFNLERQANEDFQGIYDRYECTAANTRHVLSGAEKVPKVVFAEFSTFCGGWSIGSCPNFYCDFVRDCSSQIIENDNVGSVVNPQCGLDRNWKTTEEFVEFAKDADVWIYPGHGDYYFELAYKEFGEQLDKMKAVQNKQVYDTVLTGLNTWYEHRLVEYDIVLEDFCNIVGASHPLLPHQRGFLRNVFDEEVGDLGQCQDRSVGYEMRAEDCVSVVELIEQAQRKSGGGRNQRSTVHLGLAAVIAMFWIGAFM